MLLLFSITIQLTTCSLAVRVSSYCGDPGLPPDATLYNINSGRIRFHDGEVVRYRCSPDFHTFSQTRKCVSGRWVGERARCGNWLLISLIIFCFLVFTICAKYTKYKF